MMKVIIQGLQALNTVTVVPLVEGNFEYALNDGPYQESPVLTGVPPGTQTQQSSSRAGKQSRQAGLAYTYTHPSNEVVVWRLKIT